MATRAITPNAPAAESVPFAEAAPIVNERINVLVIGPEATPPESKAIPIKSGGLKKVKRSATA